MLASNAILSVLLVILPDIWACDSEIYCQGRLLKAVQMARVHNDSKTFVDMKMTYDANTTMSMFDQTNSSDVNEIHEFVKKAFEPEGAVFEDWEPKDWKEKPTFLDSLKNPDLYNWAFDLNGRWKKLGRKMNGDLNALREYYSIIPVTHPVIIPGGRFREFYYWDSYWIVRGLLVSEMYETVEGMLDNFLSLVDEYGFVPNGGRIYYTERSQPPLLAPMVKSYIDARFGANETEIVKFLKYKNYTVLLEKELDFWLKNRILSIRVNGTEYKVAVYKQSLGEPRPESYSEDVRNAEKLGVDEEEQEFYKQIRSAAESGWDFSSRWFVRNGTHNGDLRDIKTSTIVPVDLNAILQWNARIIAEFYRKLENVEKFEYYYGISQDFQRVLDDVLWNEEYGVWMDYDSVNEKSRPYFYASNLAPLWTQSDLKLAKDVRKAEENYLTSENKLIDSKSTWEKYDKARVSRILDYLNSADVNIRSYPGGVPTTLFNKHVKTCDAHWVGEQWDFPNAWPPLQHMAVQGLYNSGHEEAKALALELCSKWIYSNYKAYDDTKAQGGNMYEKYNALCPGAPGNGGEYNVQLGFGWTNGVILDFLHLYADELPADLDTTDMAVVETPRLLGVREWSANSATSIVTRLVVNTGAFLLLLLQHSLR